MTRGLRPAPTPSDGTRPTSGGGVPRRQDRSISLPRLGIAALIMLVAARWYVAISAAGTAATKAGVLSLASFLVPAFGLALASILLREPVTLPQVLGTTPVVANAAATVWRSPVVTHTTSRAAGASIPRLRPPAPRSTR